MDKANTDWWGVKIKDEGKILFFIILSALLFRILAFFLTDRTNSDTVDYCLSAIYLHKGMIAEAVSVRNMYPMLYPLILSSAFYLGIAPITLGVIISIILGTAVVYIAYYISNLLFENRGISLIAAAFVAVSPPLIDSASSCLRDTPGLFSGALAMVFLILGIKHSRLIFWALAGIFCGTAVLLRIEYLDFFPLIICWMAVTFIFYRKERKYSFIREYILPFSLFTIAFFLVELPFQEYFIGYGSSFDVFESCRMLKHFIGVVF